MAKRKTITAKTRLEVLKRDNYTCQVCGKSPALYPELQIDAVVKLEIDHFQPHSKEGSDDLDNLQTLCMICNRGKGNDENLNITIQNKIIILINKINPKILYEINATGHARVVANENDFQELIRLNSLFNSYKIDVIPNTISGYHAGFNMGIYTIEDHCGTKINFVITKK
jgi:hypothetical protein